MTEAIFTIIGVVTGFLGNYFLQKEQLKFERRKLNIAKMEPLYEEIVSLKINLDFDKYNSIEKAYDYLKELEKQEAEIREVALRIAPYFQGKLNGSEALIAFEYEKFKNNIDKLVADNQELKRIKTELYNYSINIINRRTKLAILLSKKMQ